MKTNDLTPEQIRAREVLIDIASKKRIITYSKLCEAASLPYDMSIPYDRVQIGALLGAISRFEHLNGRPMLSSVVVTANNQQGNGFFELAEELGFGKARKLKSEGIFEIEMMNRTHDFWSRSKH